MTATPVARISVRIPRDTFYLGLVRKVVVELAGRVGFGAQATAEIEMAVDEACSNAIRHAGRGLLAAADEFVASRLDTPDPGGGPLGRRIETEIAVEASAGPDALTVTLTDGGAPFAFDRCGSGTADLEAYLAARTPNGLGVYIIKRFMDEVEYRHVPSVGNEIRMTKYLVTASSKP